MLEVVYAQLHLHAAVLVAVVPAATATAAAAATERRGKGRISPLLAAPGREWDRARDGRAGRAEPGWETGRRRRQNRAGRASKRPGSLSSAPVRRALPPHRKRREGNEMSG